MEDITTDAIASGIYYYHRNSNDKTILKIDMSQKDFHTSNEIEGQIGNGLADIDGAFGNWGAESTMVDTNVKP